MIIKLKDVRIAFPVLFTPKAVNASDKPAFSASFIIGKNDPQIAEIRKVMEQVAKEKWGDKADKVYKSLIASQDVCLRDGDTKAEYDGFEGNYYLAARSASAPLVIDRDKTELTEAKGLPYAGSYVNCSLDIWAQENNYGKRINAKLRGVQFFRDGDAFSGSAPADPDEFDDVANTGESDDLV